MWYSIDIIILIQMLMPSILQKPRHLAWLKALLAPLMEIHEEFKIFRVEFNRRLRYNGQVIVLENLLNNLFDIDDRGILVQTNPSGLSQIYLFNKEENQVPNYIYQKAEGKPIYIFQKNENLQQIWDFEVIVPDGILTAEQERQLKAITNKHKLDGKRPRFIYQSGQTF